MPLSLTSTVRGWLREPLVHFTVAGGLMFGLYLWFNPTALEDASDSAAVRIGTSEVRWLSETWTRQWRREPTPDELQMLAASHVREELLAREARAMGLDNDDVIVRRRLAQKLEFLIRDTAGLDEPTEDELRRFHADHADLFASAARLTLSQVYFSRERRRNAEQDARAALARLNKGAAQSAEEGDVMLFAPDYREVDEPTVAATFGPEFARSAFGLQSGAWHGPIASGYGFHLVKVSHPEPGAFRDFAEVRAQVLDRWREQRGREREAQFLAGLMKKYGVEVDDSVKAVVGSLSIAQNATGSTGAAR